MSNDTITKRDLLDIIVLIELYDTFPKNSIKAKRYQELKAKIERLLF